MKDADKTMKPNRLIVRQGNRHNLETHVNSRIIRVTLRVKHTRLSCNRLTDPIRPGSLADKPPQTKIHLCPLLSKSGC
jgi:hypothetical protein